VVTHINFAVDDALADQARTLKDENDLSWPEFLALSVETLEQAGLTAELEDATTVHRTGIQISDSGDGEWTGSGCGCKSTVGYDGELCVITCDEHGVERATEIGKLEQSQ
jgi:hypothetical protein